MSNLTNQQKATYALLADNVYWDVRHGYKEINEGQDFTNSNWTPVPEGWTVIDEISGSGEQGKANHPELEGFTARAYQNSNSGEIVISFAGTEDFIQGIKWSGDGKTDVALGTGFTSEQANQAAIFYHQVKQEHPNANISFTGHSLGGGLASIMGIWFDKKAVVFDPAPFKSAVEERVYESDDGSDIRIVMQSDTLISARRRISELFKEGEIKEIDESFRSYEYAKHFNDRINNITSTVVDGEFLHKFSPSFLDLEFISSPDKLITGETTLGAAAKHSQTLLVSALLDENFEHYASVKDDNRANRDTLSIIMDEKLYGYSQKESAQNFLTKLVRSHTAAVMGTGAKDFVTGDTVGVKVESSNNSLLMGFGRDLKGFAENLKGYYGSYVKLGYVKLGYDVLIANAVEWYYFQDIKTYNGKRFMSLNGNTLQFTTAKGDQLPDFETSKVGKYSQKWVSMAYLINAEVIRSDVVEYDQWNIALNNADSNSLDIEKSQILISLGKDIHFTSGEKDDLLFGYNGDDTLIANEGDDSLYGGAGNDHLDGGAGRDTLHGGAGNDHLYGGADRDTLHGGIGVDRLEGGDGYDTYYVDNQDTIKDSDGRGNVYLKINDNPKNLLRGGTTKIGGEEDTYYSRDGKTTYKWDKASGKLTVNNGLVIEDFKNGDLGINLTSGQDIAFVVDISGSMEDDIRSVVSHLDGLLNTIFDPHKGLTDSRVAIAAYESSTSILQPFTNHDTLEARKAAAHKAISSMPDMIGGGTENLYHALYDVLTGKAGQWRDDARSRTILLIGDEPGDDRYFASQVYAVARNLKVGVNISARNDSSAFDVTFTDPNAENDPISVTIHPILIGNDPSTIDSFNDIANATGGSVHNSSGASDIAAVLYDALQPSTPYDDVMTGNEYNNTYHGGAGNDIIQGFDGNDKLYGDDGDDILEAGKGEDYLYGEAGRDKSAKIA